MRTKKAIVTIVWRRGSNLLSELYTLRSLVFSAASVCEMKNVNTVCRSDSSDHPHFAQLHFPVLRSAELHGGADSRAVHILRLNHGTHVNGQRSLVSLSGDGRNGSRSLARAVCKIDQLSIVPQ